MRGISLEKISYSRGKREIEKNLKNAKRIEMSRKHQINEKKSKFAKRNWRIIKKSKKTNRETLEINEKSTNRKKSKNPKNPKIAKKSWWKIANLNKKKREL